MATQAHCFYCFECLAASFEDRKPSSLNRTEQLWAEYTTRTATQNTWSTLETQKGESLESVEDFLDKETDEADDNRSVLQAAKDMGVHNDEIRATTWLQPQLPSISRLQATSPRSNSSSPFTTPSTASPNSSNSALATPASSTTSFGTTSSTSSQGQRTKKSTIYLPPSPPTSSASSSFPMFVTWNTISRTTGQKSLRGCIGTFEPVPLASGLETYALTSAFEDSRFSPISRSLLPSLSCNITLLANFETCAHPFDWTLGTHGLKITFTHRGRRHGATYLPDVAIEQGWTKEKMLDSLMRKSGWNDSFVSQDNRNSNSKAGRAGTGASAGAAALKFFRSCRGGGGGGGGGRRGNSGCCSCCSSKGSRNNHVVDSTDDDDHHDADGDDHDDHNPPQAQKPPWERVSNFSAIRYTGSKAAATYDEWRRWRDWVETTKINTAARQNK